MNRRDFIKTSVIAGTVLGTGTAFANNVLDNKKYEEYDYSLIFKPRPYPYDRLLSCFEPVNIGPAEIPEFPLDLLQRNSTEDIGYPFAYSVKNGKEYIEKYIDGDYIYVEPYPVGSSACWHYGHCLVEEENKIKEITVAEAKLTNAKIVDPYKALEDSYVAKMVWDQLQTLLVAGYDRNVVVVNSDKPGINSRMNALMKTAMRRNGGGNGYGSSSTVIRRFTTQQTNSGNSTSIHRGRMTDLYVPKELAEAYLPTEEELDKETAVFINGYLNRYYGVNIHPLKELNSDGDFAVKHLSDIIGDKFKMPINRTHLVIGVDQSRSAFVTPVLDYVVEKDTRVEIRARNMCGITLLARQGNAVLNNKQVLLGLI